MQNYKNSPLYIRTSELVCEAADGTVIVIQRRGEIVSELRPIASKSAALRLPALTELWRRFPSVSSDSGNFLRKIASRAILIRSISRNTMATSEMRPKSEKLIRRAPRICSSAWALVEVLQQPAKDSSAAATPRGLVGESVNL